jgi:DNA repair protein RecN (Recombination protein N)
VLAQSERVQELARMLAGMDGTATGLAHAEELLAVADADKRAAELEKDPGAARASKKTSDGAARKRGK